MGGALLGLLKSAGSVLLGKTAADSAGLLGAEVEREVLLVLVEETELSPLLGVDDGEDTSDRLAEVVAVKRCACQPTRSFLPNFPKDSFPVSQYHGLGVVRGESACAESTYILLSLVPEETIFWMRS